MYLAQRISLNVLFLSALSTLSIGNAIGQKKQNDSSCIKCEAKLTHIISIWDSLIINHNEIKLIGYERKFELPADSVLIKKIFTSDSVYTGYVFDTGKGLKAKLALLQEVGGTEIVELDNKNDTIKISFPNKDPNNSVLNMYLKNGIAFYEITYLYNGKIINLPYICGKSGVILGPILLDYYFLNLNLN